MPRNKKMNFCGLAETKIAPATERPAALPPPSRQADAAIPVRNGKNKRVQADR